MPSYTYPKDGKLHTRYSELVRATPAQVERLVAERFGSTGRFENNDMRFGTLRHKMFERECRETGFLPTVFKECLPNGRNLKVSASEYYFETPLEIILDGIRTEVVIHSTVDAYLAGDHVTDFKVTTQDKDSWGSKQQLVFYAYLMGLHGIQLKRTIYLLEKWEVDEKGDKKKLLGYQMKEQKLAEWKLKMVRDWIDDRVFTLKMGIDMFLENNPGLGR